MNQFRLRWGRQGEGAGIISPQCVYQLEIHVGGNLNWYNQECNFIVVFSMQSGREDEPYMY